MTINDIHAKLAAINRTAGECLSYLYQVDASHKRLVLNHATSQVQAIELDHQGRQIAKGIDHIKCLKTLLKSMGDDMGKDEVAEGGAASTCCAPVNMCPCPTRETRRRGQGG